MNFKDWLDDNSKIIIFDGGMGTEIIKRGIKPGKIPDLLNIEEPEVISEIHKAYYEAGSDMCQTNTFGSSYLNLKNHKLEGRMAEIVSKAIENIKKACPSNGLIVGDIGPSGEFKPPVGKATFEQWYESYRKQVKFLEGGIDLWHIETISDIEEMLAAVKAVKEISKKPIISSMTYKKTKRGFFTIMGNSLDKCVQALEKEKIDVIGANCTISSNEMIELTKELKNLTNIPISIKPNAGKPQLDKDGSVYYNQTIEEYKEDMKQIIKLGAKIVGGCCGTSPQNILALSEIIKSN
ncbi:MAG: homocysteine S-methyltransferase family protein [Candidatus Thorarchaeota archaeon]